MLKLMAYIVICFIAIFVGIIGAAAILAGVNLILSAPHYSFILISAGIVFLIAAYAAIKGMMWHVHGDE